MTAEYAPTLLDLHGVHRGETVTIAAPGPSLAAESCRDWSAVGPVVLTSWAVLWPESGTMADYWLTVDPEVIQDGSRVDTYRHAVLAVRRLQVCYSGRAPGVPFNLGAVDRRTWLLPGMETREYLETGRFPGQDVSRNTDLAPERLMCPGSTLVCAVHLALVLTAGEGRIVLIGADGRNREGSRRMAGAPAVDGAKAKRQAAQLAKANESLGKTYEALRGGLPALELVNATPGSAIPGWPIVERERVWTSAK